MLSPSSSFSSKPEHFGNYLFKIPERCRVQRDETEVTIPLQEISTSAL